MNGFARGLAAGAVGAAVLTAVHQLGRATLRHPPRMDVVGRRAIRRGAKRVGRRVRRGEAQRWAFGGDLVANALYYALATRGSPAGAPLRGTLLGALAGVGGVALPGAMGLGREPVQARASTAILTVAIYTLGGLAAGWAARRLGAERGDPDLRSRLAAGIITT